MFEKYVEQALKIFSYVDSILITDKKGNLTYYHTNRTELNTLNMDEAIGKNILDLFVNLDEDSSTVMQTLKTGRPFFNHKQKLRAVNGVSVDAISNTLPIKEFERIIGVISISSYALETMTLPNEKAKSKARLYQLSDIVSSDPKMSELKDTIKKIAGTPSSVMIYGETGTGKALVAQSIHTCGERREYSFISQNCAAIPSSLMESILFGTKKGSFTGAKDNPGLFELADKGTLFLDEINSIELPVQAKLLKAVMEKKITRVGGNTPIYVDVKIITAINKTISDIMNKSSMRKDLLYRLNTIYLEVPPLRERIDDIPPLAKYFIRGFNRNMKRDVIDLTEEVYDIFTKYNWPGNVRELKNSIKYAFNLCSGRFIEKNDLPDYMIRNNEIYEDTKRVRKDGLKATMEKIEKDIILKILSESANKTDAAQKLKISKQTFQYKLEKYDLEKYF